MKPQQWLLSLPYYYSDTDAPNGLIALQGDPKNQSHKPSCCLAGTQDVNLLLFTLTTRVQ
jgi:hypothetical protein